MTYIVTTPTGKELFVDEDRVCTNKQPIHCMKYTKEIVEDYLQIAREMGYTIRTTQ